MVCLAIGISSLVEMVRVERRNNDDEMVRVERRNDVALFTFVFLKKINGFRVNPRFILDSPNLTQTKINGFRVMKSEAGRTNPIEKNPF